MKYLLILLGQPFTFVIKSVLIVILFLTKLLAIFHPPRITLPKFKKPILKTPSIYIPKLHLKSTSILLFFAGVLLSYLSHTWYTSLPSIEGLKNPPSQTTKILDRHGVLLYQIYRDENRTLVKLDNLPPHFIQATLAAEDKNFYKHHGLDTLAIVRAAYKNLRNCSFLTRECNPEGGSTLTQQLIKNTLLGPEKTIDRKLKEAVLALKVETQYSKNEILEMYLNQVSYGGTSHGIQAASETYFDKNAAELTLAESALLAGLTVSPTTLSPLGSRPYLAKDRQNFVLNQMVQMGSITADEALLASQDSLVLKPKKVSLEAPHFVMWLREQLVNYYGEKMITQGGLTITTTLDLELQHLLEKNISSELKKLQGLNVQNGAGLITSPSSGDILAMVGSQNYYDYGRDGQVNVTTALRQPGSSIKPITYTLALQSGLRLNSTILDAPVCFSQPGQSPYCPKNYDGRFHGNVTLRQALANSYNIPAVKLLNSLGLSRFITLAKAMGITTWEDSSRFGLALTLGSGEVTMLDLAVVYGTFANSGTKTPLNAVLSVSDSSGNSRDLPPRNKSEHTISPDIAFQINDTLADRLARSQSFGYNSVLNIPGHQVAVKTGTTNNLRDNWTIGYTQDYLVATWVGNNDNTPMSYVASGVTGASPIWRQTIEGVLKTMPAHEFNKPENTKRIAICRDTGLIYCESVCPTPPIYEYFIAGNEPTGNCQQLSGTILDTSAITP